MLVLRDIYNEFAKLRYKLITQKTPIERVLAELDNQGFFYAYEDDGTEDDSNKPKRLRCVFFVYPNIIKIYKDNNYILILDCTYKVYASSLPLLCFDFIIRLGKCLLLAHVLIPDKLFDRYK